jgi:hypothetical protein
MTLTINYSKLEQLLIRAFAQTDAWIDLLMNEDTEPDSKRELALHLNGLVSMLFRCRQFANPQVVLTEDQKTYLSNAELKEIYVHLLNKEFNVERNDQPYLRDELRLLLYDALVLIEPTPSHHKSILIDDQFTLTIPQYTQLFIYTINTSLRKMREASLMSWSLVEDDDGVISL